LLTARIHASNATASRLTILSAELASANGVAESGGVCYKGDSPGSWHASTGGGIWVRGVYESAMLTVLRTTDPEHLGIQFRLGLSF
jgi:hypothetical protein